MVPKTAEKKRKREVQPKSKPVQEAVVESEQEADDHTAALLKGFESSDEEHASGDEGYKEGQPVPAIPDSKKLSKKLEKATRKSQHGSEEVGESGVVYVGYDLNALSVQ